MAMNQERIAGRVITRAALCSVLLTAAIGAQAGPKFTTEADSLNHRDTMQYYDETAAEAPRSAGGQVGTETTSLTDTADVVSAALNVKAKEVETKAAEELARTRAQISALEKRLAGAAPSTGGVVVKDIVVKENLANMFAVKRLNVTATRTISNCGKNDCTYHERPVSSAICQGHNAVTYRVTTIDGREADRRKISTKRVITKKQTYGENDTYWVLYKSRTYVESSSYAWCR